MGNNNQLQHISFRELRVHDHCCFFTRRQPQHDTSRVLCYAVVTAVTEPPDQKTKGKKRPTVERKGRQNAERRTNIFARASLNIFKGLTPSQFVCGREGLTSPSRLVLVLLY